ncbi:hypothetical protein SRABI36_04235 [Pedobacter sp. Bi36]|nr:hypothetical protein SRABI126_01024 [Pedobacter sp. Bi126]CAH0288509.1 hypothetical protein SRABI36_04235 [Pedobacter sp. Bi36]
MSLGIFATCGAVYVCVVYLCVVFNPFKNTISHHTIAFNSSLLIKDDDLPSIIFLLNN